MPLVLTPLPNVPLIRSGASLPDLILKSLSEASIQLSDGDIVVIAQKIISKAEGRLVHLSQVEPSQQVQRLARETEKDPRLLELILRESSQVLRTRPGTIIVEHKLGFVCANAGIDHSNVASEIEGDQRNPEEWVLLLPENPDESARRIRSALESQSGAQIGVLIIDSHGRAWRNGTTGVCIGLSGMPGLVDLRGQPDLYDFKLRITTIGAADELAGAASLMMGQANEGTPIVHVRGFPYPLREAVLQELIRDREQDMFR